MTALCRSQKETLDRLYQAFQRQSTLSLMLPVSRTWEGAHMAEPPPKAVLEAADVSAVSQLILRERVSRDLGLWEQMRDCYHDDSAVRISWINASGPEFVRRSKEMAERNGKPSNRSDFGHPGR